MDSSARRHAGRGRRAALALTVLLVLLAAVALASRGDTPTGEARSRRPSEHLLDALISLFVVAVVLSAILVVVVFVVFRQDVGKALVASRGRRNWLLNVAALLLLITLVALGARAFSQARLQQGEVEEAQIGTLAQPPSEAPSDETADRYRPEFSPFVVGLVLALLLVAAIGGAAVLRAQARRYPGEDEENLTEALAAVLDDTVDDLRAERDPRRAVIGAYARLEQTLSAYGLPRAESEAPGEYLERVLSRLDVGTLAIQRLTALFEQAKFSDHEIGVEMKEEAIDTLIAVREELRASAAEAEAALAAPVVT